MPGTDWTDGYPKAATLVLGLQGCRDLATATAAAAAFVDPLLAEEPLKAAWNPATGTWEPHP